jgi:hypothetical protein
MLERGISRSEVKEVILAGEIIKYYGDYRPYPSALVMAEVEGRALHVVAAYDGDSRMSHIITAYVPDLEHFEEDMRTRRDDEQR